MDKCREEFESSLERTDGLHDGYVTWNEASGMYMANDDDYECMADWMNGAFAIHRKMQAKVEELQQENLRLAYGNTSYYNQAVKQNEIIEGLQKQFDQHDKLLLQRNKDVQELYDINAKHVAEKAEMQKRVDKCQQIIQKWNGGGYDIFDVFKEIEQALKGEG
ncbi:hypothetical protein ACT4WE_11910 [Acinetobacter baumannii]